MKELDYKEMVSMSEYRGTLGAAIGDIAGSFYEFQSGPKSEKATAELFFPSSCFTDDTVCTVGVADYLLHRSDPKADPSDYLHRWTRKYMNAGYGGRMLRWVLSDNPKPYNSFGNGAAMRVSPVAYFAKSEEDVYALSDIVTATTHNHPEGLKAGRVISMCIYKALHGATRSEIAKYAISEYPEIEKLNYDQMRAFLGHGEEICQVTVPQALWAFLHSDSFEDCLRLCIAIRWDCDTLAAIACPIAEAFYKEIPAYIIDEATKRLPDEIKEVLYAIR